MTVTEEYWKAHFVEILDIASRGEVVLIIKTGESEPRLQLYVDREGDAEVPGLTVKSVLQQESRKER